MSGNETAWLCRHSINITAWAQLKVLDKATAIIRANQLLETTQEG
jgi:hypothetical protein